jgi:hypothetical protein
MRYDRNLGDTFTITIRAAFIEDAPRYDDCRSTESDRAFTSSDSEGIASRFRLSSSHSVSWLGICSRVARLLSSSTPELLGDRYSCVVAEFMEPAGEVWDMDAALARWSRIETSSCRDNGNNDWTSVLGYSFFRIERHSSSDCCSASRVLRKESVTVCQLGQGSTTSARVSLSAGACHSSTASESGTPSIVHRAAFHRIEFCVVCTQHRHEGSLFSSSFHSLGASELPGPPRQQVAVEQDLGLLQC